MNAEKSLEVLPVERAVFTVGEVCKILGLRRSSAYAAISDGHIPSIRIGGQIRVPRGAVERMLKVD